MRPDRNQLLDTRIGGIRLAAHLDALPGWAAASDSDLLSQLVPALVGGCDAARIAELLRSPRPDAGGEYLVVCATPVDPAALHHGFTRWGLGGIRPYVSPELAAVLATRHHDVDFDQFSAILRRSANAAGATGFLVDADALFELSVRQREAVIDRARRSGKVLYLYREDVVVQAVERVQRQDRAGQPGDDDDLKADYAGFERIEQAYHQILDTEARLQPLLRRLGDRVLVMSDRQFVDFGMTWNDVVEFLGGPSRMLEEVLLEHYRERTTPAPVLGTPAPSIVDAARRFRHEFHRRHRIRPIDGFRPPIVAEDHDAATIEEVNHVLYTARDRNIVDYGATHLGTWDKDDHDVLFRKPATAHLRSPFVICLGAAQTFGTYCERPYPSLLEAQLGLPVLNYGVGGAGPEFFLHRPDVLAIANQSACAVISVMSGRSVDSVWTPLPSGRLGTGIEKPRRPDEPTAHRTAQLLHLVETSPPHESEAIVAEIRDIWLAKMIELLQAIRTTKVLFWFARESPDYFAGPFEPRHLAVFPQLITRAMIDTLQSHADAYVECASRRGVPMLLRSRFHGLPSPVFRIEVNAWETYNRAYPSDQMHEDAATSLLPSVVRALSRSG